MYNDLNQTRAQADLNVFYCVTVVLDVVLVVLDDSTPIQPTLVVLWLLLLLWLLWQEFLVAVRLQGATMRHYVTQTGHSWYEQVGRPVLLSLFIPALQFPSPEISPDIIQTSMKSRKEQEGK